MNDVPDIFSQLSPLQRAALTIKQLRGRLDALERAQAEPIAVVGMGCRFPGAVDSPEAYWSLLQEGRDAFSDMPRDRWDVDAYFDPDPSTPGKIYTRGGYFLRDLDRFDAQFFGLSPREANSLDPQHRLLLEVSWEALEDAGQSPDDLVGSRTGVFVGIGQNDYAQLQLYDGDPAHIDTYDGTGNGFCFASGRLAHIFGHQGPNLAIDTACSSSLVAVHLACQSLRLKECDLALAGGVQLVLSPEVTVFLCRARALSADGRCKTFDASADGYGRGEGCGMIVLKRLSDAVAAKDNVLAVIRGSAVNHNGHSSGLTVPNGQAQQSLLRQALAAARVSPAEVDYLETHGTGTSLGDPIEVRSLDSVLSEGRAAADTLYIGSVKTNIGHLEAAAGIAGLIKVVLALKHGAIPASLHFETPNPSIAWQESCVAVPRHPITWPSRGRRRIAGVSSFGISGTNAHVVLEESPPNPEPQNRAVRPLHVFTLSAKSREALVEQTRLAESYLQTGGVSDIADACFTANAGRAQHHFRLALLAESVDDAQKQLAELVADPSAGHAFSGSSGSDLSIAWLFSGQGSQYSRMGEELYHSQPTFRRTVEECDAILHPELSGSIVDALFSPDNADQLNQTAYTQPALFVLEYALAELWASWGLQPSAVMGHSVGEYAAACRAGVFSLDDGLRLIAARGRLMQTTAADGLMVALAADHASVASVLEETPGQVSVAALNGPRSTVISGARSAVEAVVERLAARGIAAQPLRTSHAFHSPLIEPMLDEFAAVANGIAFSAPKIPLVSNLTGAFIGDDIATPDYWCRQARQPVLFAAGLAQLVRRKCSAFVEIGPAPVLLGMARQVVTTEPTLFLPSLRQGVSDWRQILGSLAQLYVRGAAIDWTAVDGDYARQRVRLPTYPFERQRFWVTRATAGRTSEPSVSTDWLYRLDWCSAPRLSGPKDASEAEPGFWLILADRGGIGLSLGAALRQRGNRCFLFGRDGEDPAAHAGGQFSSGPLDLRNVQRLRLQIDELRTQTGLPLRGAIHLWTLDAPSDRDAWEGFLAQGQDQDCGATLSLARALAGESDEGAARLWIVTRSAQPAGNTTRLNLCQSALWGLGKSIALEHPANWGGLIDLDEIPSGDEPSRLLAEVCQPPGESQVALRQDGRWVPRLVRCPPVAGRAYRFRRDASYLITGGLGFLGLQIARWLVRQGIVNLVLVGRSEPSSQAKSQLAELEKSGARLLILAADIAERSDVARVLERSANEMPPLRGIFHAAGIAGHRPLHEIDLETLRGTLRPKVAGAWLLDRMTEGLGLDLFVCFSSISALWGAKGLACYTAANHFLDLLAHDRRARGLPALTVNWGPWSGGGMAAAPDYQEALDRLGIAALTVEQNLAALARLLSSGLPQAAVADIDWRTFGELYRQQSRTALLERLDELDEPPTPARDSFEPSLRRRLQECGAGERRRLLIEHLQHEVASILDLADTNLPNPREGFFQLGMDSLMAVELRNAIAKALGENFPAAVVFDFPTIDELAGAVLRQLRLDDPRDAARPRVSAPTDIASGSHEPIAIVGMACRLPGGANDPEQFWQLLCEGRDAIRRVPADRWDADLHYDPDPEAAGKTYTRHGGFIDEVDLFDAQYFGISPREAAEMDPQQRLLLEVSHAALENAGRPIIAGAGDRTGVFLGLTNNEYGHMFGGSRAEQFGSYYVTGNSLNAAAGRISYALGLRGPSLTVDTACSSSLVAVHLACRSLWSKECDEAIAAGANLILTPGGMIAACRAHMLSVDGRCKTFDASADGYGRGEGVGVVVLARLSDALARGARIWAVIRGSAMNQDGRSSGFTVPNGLAQQAVIREALANAGVAPGDVGYVEAHGTGTPLGDPIEVGALAAVYADNRPNGEPVLVGSVKANIGHLESAAGIAGIIKTALVLHSGEIPRLPHLRAPNPEIAWDRLAIRPVDTHMGWPGPGPRIAGLSSFGVTGTNAHVVLEASAETTPPEPAYERPLHLLTISAKTPEALRRRADDLANHLDAHPELPVGDVCFTANARARHPHRAAWTVASLEQARDDLRALSQREPVAGADEAAAERPKIAFLFGGEECARAGMGRELYETQPVFRSTVDTLAEILRRHARYSLTDMMFGEDTACIGDPACTCPATFALDYALAELWKTWGIVPDVVLGQGAGEYAAACVAGMLDPEEGMRLSVEHGRRMAHSVDDNGSAVPAVTPGAYRAPRITFISSTTGDAGNALRREGCGIFVAIGSDAQPFRQDDVFDGDALWLPSLQPGAPEWQTLLGSLGALYVAAAGVDLQGLDHGYARRVVSLPTYPFQRRRHWLPGPPEEKAATVVQSKPVSRGTDAAPETAARFYEVQWQLQPVSADLNRRPGHWLVFADEGGIGEEVSRLLRQRGADTTVVHRACGPFKDRLTIEPETRADYRQLVARVAEKAPVRGVIHLWSLDARLSESSDNRALQDSTALGCRSALYLAQALIGAQLRDPPRVYVVTRGATNALAAQQPATPSADGLAQAPVWGFAKVLASEHDELHCRLIDLDPAGAPDARMLVDEICSNRDAEENRLAFRNGQRYVARLAESHSAARSVQVRPDRSYLITGGFGDIGIHVAGWLVAQGARHLVLLGRSGGSAAARTAIRSFEQAGVRTIEARVDVARPDQLAELFAQTSRDQPPLAGVIHAAGISADRLIANHDWTLFEEVFAAKIHGAWNLHQLTKDLDLDFFLLFSSASTLLGGAGTANYVAANEFLDALAAYRRSIGLPGLSIAWGAWADIGMAKRVGLSRETEWQAIGICPLTAADALGALSQALGREAAQVGIMCVDWNRFRRHPSGAALSRFTELLAAGQESEAEQRPSLRFRLERSRSGERKNLLLNYVRTQVETVLGWKDGERINLRHGFFDLGMDSLQANELRTRLQRELECALPPTLTFKFPTVLTLTDHLSNLIFADTDHHSTDHPLAGEPVAADEAVDDIDVQLGIGRELAQLEKLLGRE